jgi:RHS repeat-associated protein
VEFLYDPLGRRVAKRVFGIGAGRGRSAPAEETRFVWDGDLLVHEVRRRAAAGRDPIVEERTYCFEDDSFIPRAHRVGRIDSLGGAERTWFYYVNNPSGAPEELVTADGEVVCRFRREPWGATEEEPGSRTGTSLRFQGQLEDAETGLFYNRFRYYDPDAGRYISPDPACLEGGIQSYAYGVNPLRWIDPLGLTTGIVYLRVDPRTGREYVGKSKSWNTYKNRKRAHDAKLRKQCGNPGAKHEFHELETGVNPGADLAQAEEDWIRAGGGPGLLDNKIHGQSRHNYKGKVPFP